MVGVDQVTLLEGARLGRVEVVQLEQQVAAGRGRKEKSNREGRNKERVREDEEAEKLADIAG